MRVNVRLRRVRATTVAAERAVRFTYCECVFVAFGIKRAMRMRHIVVSGVRVYRIFSHYLINDTIKKKYGAQNVCFDFFPNFCLKYFFNSKKN